MGKKNLISIIEESIINKSSFIDLSGLNITSIPKKLAEIEHLKVINLSNNLIKDIKPLYALDNIRIIDLRNNKIQSIDKDIFRIGIPVKWQYDYSESGLFLENNPIANVPIEILNQDNALIASYLDAIDASNSKNLNEAKIALLGNGGVGKTSIAKALVNHTFDIHSPKTQGIEISSLFLEINHQPIKVKFWDFGGQEIMHLTHQLFLTKRTIYLLVTDSRRENNIEYWLKTVEAFAGDVPVIIVVNKIDINPGFDINQRQLLRKYPNIVSFQRVSCLTQDGIIELLDSIKLNLQNLAHLNTVIPISWFQVKEEVENLKKDYIDYSDFIAICKNYGIFDTSKQNTLSDFLHDLGIIIHFKNLPLFSTQILNPHWITNAIYRIINSEKVISGEGRISFNKVQSILSPFSKTYPPAKDRFIIEIMKEFELLFEVNEDSFILPNLLPILEPETEFSFDDAIFFNYAYDFLPSSLFPRILVRLHNLIHGGKIWRDGVHISKGKSEAIITIDKVDKKIEISCAGEDKRDLLFIVRDVINKLNKTFSNLKVDEFVLYGEKNIPINFQKLEVLKEADEKTLFVSSIHQKLDVDKLVKQIEPESKKELNPIKVFVSYSHKDIEFKSELLSHLSPLIRLSEVAVWEDGQLIPGQQWKSEILLKLNEADIVLCLISSDFISSEFCYSIELREALDAHLKKEKVVIPILIRKCFWEKLPIAEIQGIPNPPISSQKNIDEGWSDVVVGVDKSLNLIREIKYGAQQ